jgi:hypothetical protein
MDLAKNVKTDVLYALTKIPVKDVLLEKSYKELNVNQFVTMDISMLTEFVLNAQIQDAKNAKLTI